MLHTIRWRNAISAVVLTLMFFIGCISVNPALAADLPERSEVQSQLATLNKQKDLTPQDKLVQQDLTQTLETLDKIERIKSETTQLRQQVTQAPAKMNQAIDSLNALSDVPDDEATRKMLSTLSLRQLESRVSQTWTICKTRRTTWQPTTASSFLYRRSRNACRMRCIPLRSSCSRSVIV